MICVTAYAHHWLGAAHNTTNMFVRERECNSEQLRFMKLFECIVEPISVKLAFIEAN